jgi:hypothetical protein
MYYFVFTPNNKFTNIYKKNILICGSRNYFSCRVVESLPVMFESGDIGIRNYFASEMNIALLSLNIET